MNALPLPQIGRMLLATHDEEIGCEACFDALDRYAELYAQGAQPADLLPKVEQHMMLCGCCRDEFEALVRALRKAR